MNPNTRLAIFLIALCFLSISACSKQPVDREIILATTTSTQDSGLLDMLIPVFEKDTGFIVKTIAVGSGQALKMGEEGNADVLLVHSPSAEKELVEKGFGTERELVMHNDFIIVGSPTDPAEIKARPSSVDAIKAITNSESPFISRGDDSGTHKMELGLWTKAEIEPSGDWYQESGQGMAATLRLASEKQAYTLTDRATYLANKAALDLNILVEGDPILLNIYHVIIVNPEKWPLVNVEGARAFSKFLTSLEVQEMIGAFGVKEFGQSLFFPDAGKNEAELGMR